MSYLYLISGLISMAASGIFAGCFTRKTADKKDASALYGFIELSTVFLLWMLMFCLDFSFDVAVLPYSLVMTVFFATGMLGRIFAFKHGSFVLTSLLIQLSGMVICIWDILVWDAPYKHKIGIGLTLVVVSLCLCLLNGKKEKKERDKKETIKWAIFCGAACLGNMGATITLRAQQIRFEGEHKSMLMCFATFVAMLLGLLLYIKSDKRDSKAILKIGTHFPILAGSFNVALNFFVMMLATSLPLLPTSLIYPTVSVGALIITTIFSAIVFKEKMRWWQWIGVAVGIVSVGLLS